LLSWLSSLLSLPFTHIVLYILVKYSNHSIPAHHIEILLVYVCSNGGWGVNS
jgi:hypothetical protein